jgi:chromatin segregation and condensation protein Rec8/ScpA/Scc1 (kleisin family)
MFMMSRLAFLNVFASTSRSIFAFSSKKRSASTSRIVLVRRTCWARILSRREEERKRRWRWRWKTKKRKKKKKKKRRRKEKEEKWCFRRTNRCKQAASNASLRSRQKDVFSFCREEVNSFLNKLKNWKSFSCSFDVSLKSVIKNLVKKSLKRMHREFFVSSSTSIDTFIVLC